MIKSTNQVSIDAVDTTILAYVYVQSQLIKRADDYLVVTQYFKKVITRPEVEASEGIEAVAEQWMYKEIQPMRKLMHCSRP